MQPRQRRQEHAVGGHRVVDARRRQDRQVEEAERRDRDRRGHEPIAERPEHERRRLRRRRRRRRQPFEPERAQVDHVDGHVDQRRPSACRRSGSAAGCGAGCRSLRRCSWRSASRRRRRGSAPARRQTRQARTLARRARRGLGPPAGRRWRERAGDDQDGERRDLEHDEHVQHAAAWLDAEVVDDRQTRRSPRSPAAPAPRRAARRGAARRWRR